MTIDDQTWAAGYPAPQPNTRAFQGQAAPGGAPAPNRREWSRKATVLTIVGGVVVLGGAATAIGLTAGMERPLMVSYTLVDDDANCRGGSGGYSDIGPGNPVTVRNGAGEILGAGSLSDNGDGVSGVFCTWTVVVEDVPNDEDFYSIEIGRRGEVSYSRAELEQKNWSVDLSIGD